jgi:hypothetical protein
MKEKRTREKVKPAPTFTAQTYIPDEKLGDDHSLYFFLDETANFYNNIKRTLFRDAISTGKRPLSFKNAYLKRFGITARQFNAIRFDLDGNIESVKELRKLHIQEIIDRIKSTKKWLKNKASKIPKRRKTIVSTP